MLKTPVGSLEIQIDNVSTDYVCVPVPIDGICADVGGRYAIVVHFCPDQAEHTISCKIKNHTPSPLDGPESGENLELYSFYKNGAKLSLGMEGDSGYINDKRLAAFDYDTEYLDDGVQYCILAITKTEKYVFGVAWINKVTEKNDIQTWLAADPTKSEYRQTVNKIC